MRVALGAYGLMEAIAKSHGGIDDAEAIVLAAYRRALGISDDDLDELGEADPTELVVEGSPREREAAVRAMARVAASDGLYNSREQRQLLEVAARLGIGNVQAANLVAEETLNSSPPSRLRRPLGYAALVLAVAALIAIALRADDLQTIARKGDRALVLLQVDYSLERAGATRMFRGEGTGFFVGETGLIVTCKHVVQPWKFLADRVAMLDEGWTLEPESTRWRAWLAGARLLEESGAKAPSNWDTASGTLDLARMADDEWVRAERKLKSGGTHPGIYHALGNSDLVLLRARGQTPTGLTLADAEHQPQPLDEVIVLGFPRGVDLLEGVHAISAPSVGVVKRVEDTVLISSDTFPGNSGGPCLDARGRVIGVVARRVGTESLGRCLRTVHVWALLP
jgi:S1-C subfamily serine protease